MAKEPKEEVVAAPAVWVDNGQRRRHDDITPMAEAAFKELLAAAEVEADEAHAAAKKASDSLIAKIVKLNTAVQAAHGSVSQADVARLAVVQMKQSALDPTNPATLPLPK